MFYGENYLGSSPSMEFSTAFDRRIRPVQSTNHGQINWFTSIRNFDGTNSCRPPECSSSLPCCANTSNMPYMLTYHQWEQCSPHMVFNQTANLNRPRPNVPLPISHVQHQYAIAPNFHDVLRNEQFAVQMTSQLNKMAGYNCVGTPHQSSNNVVSYRTSSVPVLYNASHQSQQQEWNVKSVRKKNLLRPTAHQQQRETETVLRHPPSSHVPVVGPVVPVATKTIKKDKCFLEEKELDELVSRIADEASKCDFKANWLPDQVGLGIDHRPPPQEAAGSAPKIVESSSSSSVPPPVRSRKQPNPHRSAHKHDPDFKGVALSMQIKMDGQHPELSIESSFSSKSESKRQRSNNKKLMEKRSHNSYFLRDNSCLSCKRGSQIQHKLEVNSLWCYACKMRYKKYGVCCSKCSYIPEPEQNHRTKCKRCGTALSRSH